MNEPTNLHSCEVIPPTGLTVLVDPDEQSFLDIVFIHGFTGHPERTWVHKRGEAKHHNEDDNPNESVEPRSKGRKLNPFSKSHRGRDNFNTTIYWPRDLLPTTVSNARILTYGYDTHIRHWLGPSVSRATVCDIAWDFLVALEAAHRPEPLRPILFIVHSLGGIVVKEMLRRSSGCQLGRGHLHSVFESTVGIMFFGTPHGGADPRNFLHRIAEMAIKAAGFKVNEQIINTLLPSSERLRELRDEFIPMVHQSEWIIHSFQEQLGVGLLGGHKVVEDTSSYLMSPTIETTEHIGRNHMDMCRFAGFNDVEYKKVAAALNRIISNVSRKPREGEPPSLSEEQKRKLLDSLRFNQINARQRTIKNAHTKTCEWLLQKSEYLEWLDVTKLAEHHGLLWIKGKPGAGKSTLMKYALVNAQGAIKDRIVLSFFFNARGEDLEKSTLGMYRSLLLQLLKQVPKLQHILDSLRLTAWASSGHHQWSIESLKELFRKAVQSLREFSLACFIDALDECDEDQIRDMISFFESIGELAVLAGIRFHVCVSSRHYPHITIRKGLYLILEGQEGHNQDITNYLDGELKIGHSKLAEQIRGELQEKASGIFMWVVLVVNLLNKEYDCGRIHALRQRLRDIPSDLHELFRDILTRNSDKRNELLLCIQWVLFARHPLNPEQLYFAILSGIDPNIPLSWNRDELTMAAIKRFILDSSKGLAETTGSETVQFIHESVRDFLLKEDGLGELWPGIGKNFRGQSHEQLKQCCLAYMDVDIAAHLDLSKPLPKLSFIEAVTLRRSVTQEFPFLEYAIRNVLYHANIAGGDNVAQGDFIQRFQLINWIRLYNLLEEHEVRRYTPKASLLYILAEYNMPNLIRVHPHKLSYLKVEDGRYGMPLFAALTTGSNEAIRAFMKAEIENQSTSSLLHELHDQHCQGRNKKVKRGHNFEPLRDRNILSYVVKHEDEVLFTFLLEAGKVAPDSKDSDGRTPLSLAAENGYSEAVKLLLQPRFSSESKDVHDADHDPNCKDIWGRTPLSYAAQKENKDVVKLLPNKKGIDLNPTDIYDQTPLSYAVRNRNEAVVKLLLDKEGTDPNISSDGQTPLLYAVTDRNEAVVKLLLDKERTDPNKSSGGETPLSYAVRNRNEAVVKLLLDKEGIDPNISSDGQTPLLCAVMNRKEAVVKLLLDKERTDPNKSGDGQTPLSYAMDNRREAVVKLLLGKKSINLNCKDKSGQTPLSLAAQLGYENCLKLLLDKGADPDSKDNYGRTPLSWAAQYGQKNNPRLLLGKGADPDSKDNDGRTPLSWAAQYGQNNNLKLLLDKGADPDFKDNDGRTPLSWAAQLGYEKFLKLLLDKGADPDSKDNSGRTPLSWAAQRGYKKNCVKLLLDKGVNPNSKDNSGRTPLSWAAQFGYKNSLELLLNKGADPDSKDNSGRTPLSWAAQFRYKDTLELLLNKGADPDSKDNSGRTPL